MRFLLALTKPMDYYVAMLPKDLMRLREQLALTQVELADELGVHPMTVSRWERGTRRIPEPVAKLVHRMRAERRAKKS
jgi:DNA-binding transcriptional regulator YiaG